MYSVTGTTIRLTRGDTFAAQLVLTSAAGEPYTPAAGDSILFAVKTKLTPDRTAYVDENPLIEKTIDTEDMMLRLAPADTKDLPFGSYVYDIEVTLESGEVDTVINNASLFIVPEVV